jgi:hypothetical protein
MSQAPRYLASGHAILELIDDPMGPYYDDLESSRPELYISAGSARSPGHAYAAALFLNGMECDL